MSEESNDGEGRFGAEAERPWDTRPRLRAGLLQTRPKSLKPQERANSHSSWDPADRSPCQFPGNLPSQWERPGGFQLGEMVLHELWRPM